MSERLTDRSVKAAAPPDGKQRFVWDAEVRGFGLRVTRAGAKAFVVDYRAQGRQRRMTIGAYPDWSVAAARARAREIKRAVDLGEDPMAERREAREAAKVSDLWNRFREEHLALKSERSRRDQEAMWRDLVLPRLGSARLEEVGHADVAALHRWITETRGTPVRANRTVESLRKAFNLAIRWGLATDNPASGVARNREDPRQRYLSRTELDRLFEALERQPERVSADAIRLLALTGARKGEVLGARWETIDLEQGIWSKPAASTKQRRAHRAPLSAAALELLRRRRSETEGPYVFPGRTADAPLRDVKRTWQAACRDAGLVDPATGTPSARIHDLRHTFASLLVSGGGSLPLVGALLGHTQAQTTQRYAHLQDDPLREAADAVGRLLTAGHEEARQG